MNQKQQNSLSNLLSQSLHLLASISIVTAGISFGLAEKAISSPLISAENTMKIASIVSRTEFLENYPIGTVVCLNDRQVRVVEFNQSFQVVEIIYLDGGYQSLKDNVDYSTFAYNSHRCSY